jgi:hypothetical protein
MQDFLTNLITPQMGCLALAIVGFLWGAGQITTGKKKLGDSKAWRRILPVMPLVLGIGGAFLPGTVDVEPGAWGARIVAGLIAGMVAAHARKIVKRLFVDKLAENKNA